jgi:hypothetical protein
MDDLLSLATGALRRVGGPLFTALALLAETRRQFNLPRWTRRREFRDLHGSAVAWLDSHFELIEGGAPWLHLIGRDVRDSCRGRVRGVTLSLTPQRKASVACARAVTAVYGFDGPWIARLHSLDQALPAAGWEMTGLAVRQRWQDPDPDAAATAQGVAKHRKRWMTDRQVGLAWQPTVALGFPIGAERMRPWGRPPLAPRMRVTWSGREEGTAWSTIPGRTRGATRNYLPLEVSEFGAPELLEQALARHERALTVTIDLSYYSNPEARVRGHRVPRYVLPTRAERYRW